MILRRRHRRRQMAEAEFFQAGQETLLLLTAKHPEHEFAGSDGPAPRHDGEDQAGEKSVIEVGDPAPSQPFRLVRSSARLGHRHPQTLFRCSIPRLPIHTKFIAETANIGGVYALSWVGKEASSATVNGLRNGVVGVPLHLLHGTDLPPPAPRPQAFETAPHRPTPHT